MERHKKRIISLVIFLATLVVSRDLFRPGYFPMHDDLQVGRLYEMELCIKDGQIPCRWVPDMGYSYGYPLFNYYPPFPYYLGLVFRLLGFSFIDSVKLLFVLGFLVSGILMYLLGLELWGEWGGLLSSVLYLFVPYHSVDVYVRGAMNEFWAMAFLPGIFWALSRIIKGEDRKISVIFLAVFCGLLLLSHNLMAFIFAPGLAFFALILIYYQKENWQQNLISLLYGVIFGLGLAAFFTLPVLFEKKYVHVETMLMGYFNYLAHFVGLKKTLFTRFWGYGSSGWLQDAGMPFQVGFPHWPLAVVSFLGAIYLYIKKKIKLESYSLFLFFFLLFLFSLFLVHPRSVLLWKTVRVLEYLQFPWRFLTLVVFAISVLGGGIILLVKKPKQQVLTGLILISITVLLNFSFFRVEKTIKINDTEKLFSAKGWNKLQTDAIFDYLPIYAKAPPASAAPATPEIKEGEAKISDIKKGTNWYQFKIEVPKTSLRGATIKIPIYDFPGWQALIGKQRTSIYHDNDLGLITIEVPVGGHEVKLKLGDTPIRKIGNLISLACWFLLVCLITKKIVPPKKQNKK
jgi:uncharacterized membrane protein